MGVVGGRGKRLDNIHLRHKTENKLVAKMSHRSFLIRTPLMSRVEFRVATSSGTLFQLSTTDHLNE